MKAIMSGIQWLIDTIGLLFNFVFNIFDTIGMVFQYVLTIVDLATGFILTLPSWLQAFGLITIAICSIYIVVGRTAGKSGN